VLAVQECRRTEGNQAAPHASSQQANAHTGQPGESARPLFDLGLDGLAAVGTDQDLGGAGQTAGELERQRVGVLCFTEEGGPSGGENWVEVRTVHHFFFLSLRP